MWYACRRNDYPILYISQSKRRIDITFFGTRIFFCVHWTHVIVRDIICLFAHIFLFTTRIEIKTSDYQK